MNVDGGFPDPLRAAAMIATLAGAIGSVGFMLLAGQGADALPLALMGLWVLSPFAALTFGSVVSTRRPLVSRAALSTLMLAVPLATLAVYAADALRPVRTQAAFVFLIVPPASWLAISVVVITTALLRRGRVRGLS